MQYLEFSQSYQTKSTRSDHKLITQPLNCLTSIMEHCEDKNLMNPLHPSQTTYVFTLWHGGDKKSQLPYWCAKTKAVWIILTQACVSNDNTVDADNYPLNVPVCLCQYLLIHIKYTCSLTLIIIQSMAREWTIDQVIHLDDLCGSDN